MLDKNVKTFIISWSTSEKLLSHELNHIREFKVRVCFEPQKETRSEQFSHATKEVSYRFLKQASLMEKRYWAIQMPRQIKRDNISLPVSVRDSKTVTWLSFLIKGL